MSLELPSPIADYVAANARLDLEGMVTPVWLKAAVWRAWFWEAVRCANARCVVDADEGGEVLWKVGEASRSAHLLC